MSENNNINVYKAEKCAIKKNLLDEFKLILELISNNEGLSLFEITDISNINLDDVCEIIYTLLEFDIIKEKAFIECNSCNTYTSIDNYMCKNCEKPLDKKLKRYKFILDK